MNIFLRIIKWNLSIFYRKLGNFWSNFDYFSLSSILIIRTSPKNLNNLIFNFLNIIWKFRIKSIIFTINFCSRKVVLGNKFNNTFYIQYHSFNKRAIPFQKNPLLRQKQLFVKIIYLVNNRIIQFKI